MTIEGKNVGEEMDKMKAIQKLPHILSVALAYTNSETELNEAMKKVGGSGSIPQSLKEQQ